MLEWNSIKLKWRGLLGQFLACFIMSSVWLLSMFVIGPVLKLVKGRKAPVMPRIHNPVLLKSATKLAEEIRNGKVKSVEVVKAFIDRIAEVNPVLNAVVETKFEEALDEAQKIDLFVSSHPNISQLAEEKPLLGIPITIKEHLSVKGFHSTVGCLVRKNNISRKDSLVVHKLKEMGAIIIGTTNVPEYCFEINTNNLIYGKTINPYDMHRTCGGSSGGEGSIVSAAGSVIGIGSDIAGSIRLPAFFNGVFGHYPTPGMVVLDGINPELFQKLTAYIGIGPICRFAEDMRLVLKGIVEPSFKAKLDLKVDISSLKIFYIEEFSSYFPPMTPLCNEVKNSVQKVIEYLEAKFGIKAEKLDYPCFHSPLWIIPVLSFNEFRKCGFSFHKALQGDQEGFNVIMEVFKNLIVRRNHSWFTLISDFYETYFLKPATKIMPHEIDKGSALQFEIKRKLGNDGVLILPTFPLSAPYYEQMMFLFQSGAYTALMNVLGLPATHCPLGLSSNGLPTGIQVASNSNNDHLCLTVAEELQRAFGGWVNPSSKIVM